MSIVRGTLDALARALGVRGDQAEEVLRSERSARARLSRRQLFAGAGAIAAGTAFGFGEGEEERVMRLARMTVKEFFDRPLGAPPVGVVESIDPKTNVVGVRLYSWADVQIRLKGKPLIGVDRIEYEFKVKT